MTSDMTGEPTRPSGASGPPPTSPPPVLLTDAGAVRTVTLNRPGSFNSFDLAMKSALLDALAETSADPAVRAPGSPVAFPFPATFRNSFMHHSLMHHTSV